LYFVQAITVAGTKKNEVVFSEIQSQLKGKKYTVDVKATSDSKVVPLFFPCICNLSISISFTDVYIF
jgi:hypothetical protein